MKKSTKWVIEELENKGYGENKIKKLIKQYDLIKPFKINENIHAIQPDIKMTKHLQKVVKLYTTFYATKMFKAMRVDLTDPNTERDLKKGNIGTPGRVAKMYIGKDQSDDTELLSGRWIKSPRLASFPNEENSRKIPITKRVDIVATCSHHIAPFSSMFRSDAYAIISYIPEDHVLGISKLQRITDFVSRRGWLQEDLTKALFKEVSKAAKTKNVYVKLYNIVHNCEFLRGAQSTDGAFTSEYYKGKFKKVKYRKLITPRG